MYGHCTNFTSCIRTNSRNAIREAIIKLLEQEHGCHLLSALPYLILNTKKLRWLNILERPSLLIIGLGIGREGWTIIKTYPNDWFFLRTPDGKRPRLSALAMLLKCDAFHYRVFQDTESLLIEADSHGKFRFNSTIEPSFSLIEVTEPVRQAMMVKQYPEIIRTEAVFKAEYSKQKAKSQFDRELLISMSEGLEDQAEQINIALANTIDPFQYFWRTYDLFNQVYSNFQKLDEMNVKFLYFQPPKNYLRTLPAYNENQFEEY